MPLDPAKIEEQHQKFDVGDIIDLFEMDLRQLDGSILRFTENVDENNNAIMFGGEMYLPLPIEATGFQYSANAQFPRPHLRIANVLNTFTPVLREFHNLIGVMVKRIRTYAQFLDNGSDPDPEAKQKDQIYKIHRKVGHTKFMVEFELVTPMDAANATLPGRTIERNGCPLSYRVWDSANSIFRQGTCPYGGEAMYKVNDESTTNEVEDICGKRWRSCQLHFGTNIALPIESFPGVGQVV